MAKPKIKIRIDDPETAAIWETAKAAREEVASWPAWKRGNSYKIEQAFSEAYDPDKILKEFVKRD